MNPANLSAPLNLAAHIHIRHRRARRPVGLGSWFSEALHHVTGSPDASDQKAVVDQFRQQVSDSVVNTLAPIAAGQSSGALPGAPVANGMDSFLAANRTMLMAGGAGLLLLMALKPKKKAAPAMAFMPVPISSPQSGKDK